MATGSTPGERGGVAEAFLVALRLGLTSFGGPVAHLGYFRREDVERRRWLDAHAFTNAAVVGLLAAALWTPVWTSAVTGPVDVLVVGLGFGALATGRVPPLVV